MRILHVYQPMIYGVLYIFVSLGYNLAGHDPVYGLEGPLDWRNKSTRTTIVSIVAVFVAVPIVHMITFALYKLRVCIATKCESKNEVGDSKNIG